MTDSLAQVVGRNARQVRLDAGMTLEQVAAAVRPYGLPWTTGRVGDFEGGRVSPTLPTLFVVTLALGDITGKPVALVDLFGGSGDVDLTDVLTVPLESIRAAVNGAAIGQRQGRKFRFKESDDPIVLMLSDPTFRFLESDFRFAADLGVTPNDAADAMFSLWGRSFSSERDARAGADANAQRKGQISRQLKAELRDALAVQTGQKKKPNKGGR